MSLLSVLVPLARVELDSVGIEDNQVTITARSTRHAGSCPHCGSISGRVHSRYTRTVADLPCVGQPVTVSLQVRRFFCDAPYCPQKTFAERFGSVLPPFTRRLSRLRDGPPDDDLVLHCRSRARHSLPPPLDPRVIERILAIRDAPPAHLQRTPGPKAILYFLAHDPELQSLGLRLPCSTRTVWQALRQHGRIAIPSERRHTPLERPEPMSAWQLDFKDVSTVPAESDGKQQHVVEVLTTVDTGTSILVNAQVHENFTAETTLEAIVETLREQGQPEMITLDRDPRFVGSQMREFPSLLSRLVGSWVCWAASSRQSKAAPEDAAVVYHEGGIRQAVRLST